MDYISSLFFFPSIYCSNWVLSSGPNKIGGSIQDALYSVIRGKKEGIRFSLFKNSVVHIVHNKTKLVYFMLVSSQTLGSNSGRGKDN